MASTESHDHDDIPEEIDFSGGERGKFYREGARLHLPVNLEGYAEGNQTETWVDSVNAKAAIILDQLAAARSIASECEGDVASISKPYFRLLQSLYADEYAFAQMADSSDLIARFAGPAIAESDPNIATAASVFANLGKQIQNIARSVAELNGNEYAEWPSELHPVLTGISHGSLVAGISVASANATTNNEVDSPIVSIQLIDSVKAAVQSLSLVAECINEDILDHSIEEKIPDPAIRDAVILAASKIAPDGKHGIDEVTLYGNGRSETLPRALTPSSKKVLSQSLSKPVKQKVEGSFQGIVRQIDLDARRFQIKEVEKIGTIRCKYASNLDQQVREILDASATVTGMYDVTENGQPRLMDVAEIETHRNR